MKKNRYLPFGYHIQNGTLCIHEAEAAVVRQVFEDYQAGTSYRRIAESLAAKGIPYMENRTDWNKHMAKRMLENSRYCGSDDFPQIISADTFEAVAALIGQKSQGESLSEELDSIRSKAVCGACGAKYKRDGRSKKYEAWCCSAEGRITPKRITDQALLESVTAILNTIIREPSQLELSSPHRENYSLDVARTENQINRELEKSEVDSDYTKLLIFGCAAAKYEACTDTEPEYLTRRLLAIFEKQPLLEDYSIGLFEDTVKQVVIDADGSLWLRMINGKLIQNQAGKE
ncbi:recombinase family protein [Lacrimispora saccharolytica]|uniref:Recombinase n=1 Tax=Lacrimispora saccharolytica (strain ATCC 35040 / DSM 2544 / NRCC 2533 / WM1) TaxID=610130 RepID=D9R8H6_LACSW|nr:recombinase family protein [Lacrimispora saccharolytica]ADL05705.1 Recombinase [[Clostridium] saccharolyticum WM1]QRV20150.1 recombinase family protein [Lacrimispora saccharolytica]